MKKILYIEDNEDNVYMLSRRLQKRGYEVLVAVNGEEGLIKAENEMPLLILLDLGLPGIDGWETAKRLKAHKSTKNIPLIALSAHAMPSDIEKALAAGCDDYDSKPVDFERLLTKIVKFIPE